MEENTTTPEQKIDLPEPNPVTQASHRREFSRQVIVPILLFVLLSIALTVVFVLNDIGTVEAWSQIATIMLVGLWLLGGLILLVLVGALVYMVSSVLKVLPPYTRLTQDAIEKLKTQVEKGAEISAKPVIQIQSYLAMINAIFRRKK